MKPLIVILVVVALAILPLCAQTAAPATAAAPAAAADNTAIAKDVVAALKAEDYAQAEAKFSPGFAKSLTPAKLKAQWEATKKQFGEVTEIKSAAATKRGTAEVVSVKCAFTKKAVNVEVGFDKQQRVTSLYFQPVAKN
jgi:uncharacterized protein DUF3887